AGETMPAIARALPFGHDQRLLPGRRPHGEPAVGIEHEGRAVEHELVLTADLIDVSEREFALGDARLGDSVTNLLLIDPVRRAVRYDQKLGPLPSERPAYLPGPDVLADGRAELHPAEVDRLGHRACGEHPLLVEHAVIRQIVLVANGLDAPAVE